MNLCFNQSIWFLLGYFIDDLFDLICCFHPQFHDVLGGILSIPIHLQLTLSNHDATKILVKFVSGLLLLR